MYRHRPLSGALGSHIARFYELRAASAADDHAATLDSRDPLLRRLLPNADANIVFDLGATDRAGENHRRPFHYASFAIGAFPEPVPVAFDSGTDIFGIAFVIGRAEACLGRPALSMSGQAVPLRELWCRDELDRLERGLRCASSFEERAALVEDALARRLPGTYRADRELDAVVEHVRSASSTVRVAELASAAGLSRQHFTRWFREAVGMGPKRFALICRLEKLLDVAERGQIESWSRTATRLGWYDQAHMITDFRWMTGLSPERFRRARHGGHRE